MKSFLRFDLKTGEDLVGGIASEQGLVNIIDTLFNEIKEDEAVEIHIFRKYILIGTRKKGHGDKMLMKFTNFGFCPNSMDAKADVLMYAIKAIDDGNLPDYCYKAIGGDPGALRQTTQHVVRAYDAKIRRMQEKDKSYAEIEPFILKRDAAKSRLELLDEDLLDVSEPIIVEVPKNPEDFYEETDVAIGKEE